MENSCSMMEKRQCSSVPSMTCDDTPRTVCMQVPSQDCQQSQDCKDVPKVGYECLLFPMIMILQESCQKVPRMVCSDVTVPACKEKKVCNLVDKTVDKEIVEKKCAMVSDIPYYVFYIIFPSGQQEAVSADTANAVQRDHGTS